MCHEGRGGRDDDNGGNDDDDNDDEDSDNDDGGYAKKRGDGDDDDDHDDDDEEDYENMTELDMPQDPFAFITPKMATRAHIPEGPPIPHPGMDPKEFEAAHKKRKAYTDAVRNKKIKET